MAQLLGRCWYWRDRGMGGGPGPAGFMLYLAHTLRTGLGLKTYNRP